MEKKTDLRLMLEWCQITLITSLLIQMHKKELIQEDL